MTKATFRRASSTCAAFAVIGLGLATGCGGSRDFGGLEDAGVDGATPAVVVPGHAAVLSVVRAAIVRDVALTARFDAAKGGLASDEGELRSAEPSALGPARRAPIPHLFARAAAFADAPVSLGVGGFERWKSQWTLAGAAHVAAELHDGRAVYAHALPSSHVVVGATRDGLETFVVLEDARAPRSLRWSIARSPGIVGSKREPGGSWSLIDREDLAVVRVEKARAFDAAGRDVPVAMALTASALTLAIADADLVDARWPVVVDPFVGVALWSYRTDVDTGKDTFLAADPGGCATAACPTATGCTGGIQGAAAAWGPTLGRIVVMGGVTDTPCKTNQSIAGWYDWDSLHGRWIRGPGFFSPPATPRNGPGVASTPTGIDVLFGANVGVGNASDGYTHDGSNWFQLCTIDGTCTASDCSHFAGACLSGTSHPAINGSPPAGFVGGKHVLFSASYGETCVGSTYPLACSLLSPSPLSRAAPGSTVDTARDVLVVHGGVGGTSPLDTWEFAPSTGWVAKCGTGSLPACGPTTGRSLLAYDSRRKVTVGLFAPATTGPMETWLWDGANWTAACGTSGLPACAVAYRGSGRTFAYDPILGRTVVAGGVGAGGVSGAGFLTDTWEFYVRGDACTTGATCDAGYCVDGVCCDQPLCGTCQACNVAGAVGTCSAVKSAPDPDSCPSTTSTCDAAGACKSLDGIGCTAPGTCASAHCVASSTGDVCCTAASCAAGQICQIGTGACIGDLGYACAGDAGCDSGHCVDGVCCDTGCDPTLRCQSCKNVGNVGHCTTTVGAPVAGRAACPKSGSGDAACETSACNGSDPAACHYPSSTTTCATGASCVGGIEADPIGCDGAGACGHAAKSCNAYACGASGCKTTCAADADCAAGYYCAAGACSPRVGLGVACSATAQCGAMLFCTDGVCCGSASCPSGTCDGIRPGTCAAGLGQACTLGAQCASGACADGVCCNTACAGICEACDAPGTIGICAPVLGKPAAGHGTCPVGTSDACSQGVCDGKDTQSCAGKPGAETVCQPASCVSGKANTAITCNGGGSCPTVTPVFCDNFRTCLDAQHCNQGPCAADTDCVDGYACEAATGKCRIKTAHCKDGAPSVSIDVAGVEHDCSPYLCGSDGDCATACAESAQCAGGFLCDPSSKTCEVAGSGASSSGGCSTGGPPIRTRAAVALFALSIVSLARRRRSPWKG